MKGSTSHTQTFVPVRSSGVLITVCQAHYHQLCLWAPRLDDCSVDNCITAYYLPNPRPAVAAHCRIFFGKLKLLAGFIFHFLSMLRGLFLPNIISQSHVQLSATLTTLLSPLIYFFFIPCLANLCPHSPSFISCPAFAFLIYFEPVIYCIMNLNLAKANAPQAKDHLALHTT